MLDCCIIISRLSISIEGSPADVANEDRATLQDAASFAEEIQAIGVVKGDHH